MAGKFENRDDFIIAPSLLDEHEYLADSFIDSETGVDCIINYPPSDEECPNCLYDPDANRSANIYKSGGPYPFPVHTTCPYCGGVGKFSKPVTIPIRLRVYWGGMEVNAAMRMFNNLKVGNVPIGLLFVIGYMEDLKNFDRGDFLLVNSSVDKQEIRCKRASEAIPWGFRKNRYFAAMLERS